MQLQQIIWCSLPLFRIWVCIFAILLIHKDLNGKLSFRCPQGYRSDLPQILAQISLSVEGLVWPSYLKIIRHIPLP